MGIALYYFKNNAEKTFTKAFVYNKYDEPDSVLAKILLEVYYHKIFYGLQESCKFKAPQLLEYGYVTNSESEDIEDSDGNLKTVDLSDKFMFYIKMELIQATQVSELQGETSVSKCNEILDKLTVINNCLVDKGLYHNDLHEENVLFNEKGEIIIIDFGEANDASAQVVPLYDFCSRVKKREKMRLIKLTKPEQPAIKAETTSEGGRRSRRRHTKRINLLGFLRGSTKKRRSSRRTRK